jgi:hypothetical protein
MKMRGERKTADDVAEAPSAVVSGKKLLVGLALTLERAQHHQHAKDEQHRTPDEVDVDAERNGVVRVITRAIEGEHHAEDREHEAYRPANIESHNFILVEWVV